MRTHTNPLVTTKKGLGILSREGHLGFICAAWTSFLMFIYLVVLGLWLHAGSSMCHAGSFDVALDSLAVVCWLRTCGTQAWLLQACGILVLRLGIEPHPLHCKADSLPLNQQGSPAWIFYFFN